MQQYLLHHNDGVPVNRLPAEVFLDIASRTSFADAVASSHVCQMWRKTMLDHAQLWTNVLAPSARRQYWKGTSAVREILARARNAPVRLALYIGSHEAVDLIAQHLHHIAQLRISLAPTVNTTQRSQLRALVSPLMHALRNPAPMLEEFYISCNEIATQDGLAGEFARIPSDIFAGQAPRLETVSVHDAQVDLHPYAAFARLTAFALRTSDNMAGWHPIPLRSTASDLSSYHRLRHLVLINRATSPSARLDLCRKLPAAQLDTLELGFANGARDVFLAFADDGPRTLCLHFACFRHVLDCMRATHHVTDLRFASRGDTMLGVEFSFARGRTVRATCRIRLDIDINHVTLLPVSVFHSLTSASLHEHMWPDGGIATPAPQLQRLRILIGPAHKTKTLCGIFQLSPAARPWDVPRLQELCLSSIAWHYDDWEQPRRVGITVSALDVAFFIEHHLRFTAARLPCLTLNLLPVYEASDSAVMARLLALVESFSTTDEAYDLRRRPKVYTGAEEYVNAWMDYDFD